MRVISWNVNWRTSVGSEQGRLIRELRPDLAVLQEVNENSVRALWDATELPSMIVSEPPAGSTERRRRRLVAVGGTERFSSRRLDLGAPVEERVLAVEVERGERRATVIAYHAPPGVSWGIKKVEQAQSVTDWICAREGPVILGADANTPKLDPVDDAAVRTHWHTGFHKLNGRPGDDELWGPSPRHQFEGLPPACGWPLTRAERRTSTPPVRWPSPTTRASARRTSEHPVASTPSGPRRTSPSPMSATSEELGRLSDHAPVVVDLEYEPQALVKSVR